MDLHPYTRLKAILACVFLTTCGCAHVISSEWRGRARDDVTFPMVLNEPTAYIGSTMILGGMIIDTVNREMGTEMIILETPLDYRGIPKDEAYSRGRFIPRIPAYLDPEIYTKGRKVTMAGEVIGKEVRPLGDIYYGYPIYDVKELHLIDERPYSFWPHFSFGFGYAHH